MIYWLICLFLVFLAVPARDLSPWATSKMRSMLAEAGA